MTIPPDARPARVLFVDHAGVLGGAELSLLDIAASYADHGVVALFEPGPFVHALEARGVRVVVIAGADALRAVKKASRVPGLSALAASLRTAWRLAKEARRADLLYANTPKSFLLGAVAALFARRLIVWHLRDILDERHFSSTNIRLLVLASNARASRVVANSRATATAFVAAGGRASLVTVVHNGIDAAPFDALPVSAGASARRALGLPADGFVIGSFSRLHPWKGQRVLLDALELLPDAHALIAGGALFSDEVEYEAELRARAAQPSLLGRVHVLGARDDIPRLIAACDVIAHTSIAPEPFGRVLVEALLGRRALIASDGGGVREVVQDGVTALIVPPGDPVRLTEAIVALRDDPPRASALAAAGAVDVRRRFTRDAMLRGVDEVIRTVSRADGA